ncbi:Ankyrin repeat protein [Rickettsia slovaca str. D-CWPP]|uniref:Ankyrin repeat protein n=3 Tax=Rickettsia slovaca TaxID=35794 RepID=H8LPT7_RICSL|nr:Ankyrin repeat protein [Rickettsia slovaca 13-B]AFD20133.1 Ankyrin repeat protein [Rickettsia slovaca str. D-CWPP]
MSNQAISTINSNGETVLTYAASKGLSKVCMQLIPLMSDPAINTITKTYYYSLNFSCMEGFRKGL